MKEKIGLQDLSVTLADRAGISRKDAEMFLREYFEVINDELINNGSIKIKDFGVFKLSLMEDRESIDVTTGERMMISAHYKVNFIPDKNLAEAVNAPFVFFETTEINDETFFDETKSFQEEKVTEQITKQVTEQETEQELVVEKNAEELYREERRKCFDCNDFSAHKIYRKKYFKARKKIRCFKIIIFVLSILLLSLLGYFVYILMYLKTQGSISLSFFKYSIIIN